MSFHPSTSLGSYGRLKSEFVSDVIKKRACFGQNDPLREGFENCVPKGFTTSQIHVLCANFVKFGRPDMGKVVRYLPDKKKNFASLALASAWIMPRSARASGMDNVLRVPQISSKSVHFRRSYSRTLECRSNAPQSLSNTRQSFSFFAE